MKWTPWMYSIANLGLPSPALESLIREFVVVIDVLVSFDPTLANTRSIAPGKGEPIS